MRELLDAGQPVLGGVEGGLQQAQRERRQGEHLPAPADRLGLQALERHDRVHEPHLQRLLGGVLAAQKPDLLGLLGPHQARQQAGAEAAVEGAHARSHLTEARVLGGDREVAHEMQHVPAADRVPGHHRHDRLGQAADLHVQVGHVEAPHRARAGLALVQVARVAAHALVAARAERIRTLAGQHDHADLGVLARVLQRSGDLHHGARAEGVSHLRPRDRDLGDPLLGRRGLLVADVRVGLPGGGRRRDPGGGHGLQG